MHPIMALDSSDSHYTSSMHVLQTTLPISILKLMTRLLPGPPQPHKAFLQGPLCPLLSQLSWPVQTQPLPQFMLCTACACVGMVFT